MYPMIRMRRLRRNRRMRELVAETYLNLNQLVYPLFIVNQSGDKQPVISMPGIDRHTFDTLEMTVENALSLGIRQFLLFGIPGEKDSEASAAWDDHGVVQTALRKLRQSFGDQILLIADTCLCEYTTHGHCGIVLDGQVINDPTLDVLAKVAVSQADAGADIIAPSDMMDGRVLWIRQALDEAGHEDIPILAYSAKYASAFYNPFREAAESSPAFADRKTYQMDYRSSRQALDEVGFDIAEGADMVMVKPALGYMDILYQVRQSVQCPVAVYNVSGEYSMVKAAAAQGWLDEQATVLELMHGLHRAGADIIITYHALDVARWLKNQLIL